LRSRSIEHAWELCSWTDAIFTRPGPRETPEERRLRHAACLISDISWRAHPDYRGEQGINLLAYAALGGIDHPGRVFLALSIFYRHVGAGEGRGKDLSDQLKSVLSKRLQKRARIVGAAVRTAHMLSIGISGVIDETPLSYEDDKLVLTIPRSYAGMDGERLRRRLDALALLLGRQAEVRIGR
ncbi:MAG: exopolyphosphatase, partial [Hyphomicrobiaceae bacterium]|nr:exopolyphosphatase [Hyphomicrobiaceae bacterium]